MERLQLSLFDVVPEPEPMVEHQFPSTSGQRRRNRRQPSKPQGDRDHIGIKFGDIDGQYCVGFYRGGLWRNLSSHGNLPEAMAARQKLRD